MSESFKNLIDALIAPRNLLYKKAMIETMTTELVANCDRLENLLMEFDQFMGIDNDDAYCLINELREIFRENGEVIKKFVIGEAV